MGGLVLLRYRGSKYNSYVVWQLLRELVYITFISNSHATIRLCWKEILVKHRKVSIFFFFFLTFIMSLLTAFIFKNSHILAGIYFMFLNNILYQTWNAFNTKFGPQKKDREISHCELVALNLGENYVNDLRFAKVVKQSNLKRSVATKCFKRQPSTKCLPQTPVFMWNSALQKKFNFCFSGDLR